MKAPRKLIAGDAQGQSSAFVQALLREARRDALPSQSKAAIWKNIALQLPAPVAGMGAAKAAAVAAKGVTGAALLKGTVAVLVLSGGLWAAHEVVTSEGATKPPLPANGETSPLRSPSAGPAQSAHTAESAGASERSAPRAAAEASLARLEPPASGELAPARAIRRERLSGSARPAPHLLAGPRTEGTWSGASRPIADVPRPSTLVSPSGPSVSTGPSRHAVPVVARQSEIPSSPAAFASRLAEENQLVLEAREGLKAGHAATVLHQLEAAEARFPDGTLAQEREALTIEALWQAGQFVAARRRAEAFVRGNPGSPHAAHLGQLTAQ